MKSSKITKSFLFILFLLTSLTTQLIGSGSENLLISNQSKLGLEETINHIKTQAEKEGWKIPIIHDLKKSVSGAGFDVLPVKVIEICNPKFAGKVLENDETRFLSPMMPIRISVYEDTKGNVIISRINSELLGKMLGDMVDDSIMEACSRSESLFADIIK